MTKSKRRHPERDFTPTHPNAAAIDIGSRMHATNVKKDDGSRAIGTVLDPKGNAIKSIEKSDAFYGEVDILGKPYVTGYEPIRDPSKSVTGIYYVGYLK
jgi:hypothetical protein